MLKKQATKLITSNEKKQLRVPEIPNLNMEGSSQIINGISGNISVSVGTDLKATDQSSAFTTISSTRSSTWNRILGNEYQLFVNDPDSLTYGFIITAGCNYTYKGQGKLWDNNRNILAEEDELNLSTPGFIVVKAFRSKVKITMSGGANNVYEVNNKQFVKFNRPEGSHMLRFLDPKGQEKKYMLTSGRSYYIYNCGSCIDKDSNVVLPLFTQDDNALVTYDDDSLNSLLVSSGRVVQMSSFSQQVSVQKSFSYNSSAMSIGGGMFTSDQFSSSSSYNESYSSNSNYSGTLMAGTITEFSSSSEISSFQHSSSSSNAFMTNNW